MTHTEPTCLFKEFVNEEVLVVSLCSFCLWIYRCSWTAPITWQTSHQSLGCFQNRLISQTSQAWNIVCRVVYWIVTIGILIRSKNAIIKPFMNEHLISIHGLIELPVMLKPYICFVVILWLLSDIRVNSPATQSQQLIVWLSTWKICFILWKAFAILTPAHLWTKCIN